MHTRSDYIYTANNLLKFCINKETLKIVNYNCFDHVAQTCLKYILFLCVIIKSYMMLFIVNNIE